MALKMKDLIERTGESKSTILYYLKEGLLPQPQKPKPNVHLYDESCVQRIRLIKYLQEQFGYSIAQIKEILKDNDFDFDGSFEALVAALSLLGESGPRYDRQSFLELAGIDDGQLRSWEEAGYIVPLGDRYTKKDLEAVELLKRARQMGLESGLLEAYVRCAKELARLENDAGAALLERGATSNERYALLFDLILRYKPYIFNRHTIKEHAERCKESR